MDFDLTDEQRLFYEQVYKFSRTELGPRAEAADKSNEFDWEAWKKMGEFGLLGLIFPEEYGGSGSDVLTACLAGMAAGRGGAFGEGDHRTQPAGDRVRRRHLDQRPHPAALHVVGWGVEPAVR